MAGPGDPPAREDVMSRSPESIGRALSALAASGDGISSALAGGQIIFRSRLLFVDPQRQYIIIAASPDKAANDALIARPHANFTARHGDRHVEFAASDPQATSIAGAPAFRLRFPEVIEAHAWRMEPRAAIPERLPLHCVADERGIASFDGRIVDISAGGMGFMVYRPDITLEPGTVLKGCRIERPGAPPLFVDVEVRYSQLLELADGRRATRSGCRFLNPSAELKALIRDFLQPRA